MVIHKLFIVMLILLWSIPSLGEISLPEDPTEPFIEITLNPKQPYVQSMVRYTIKLYRHSHLQRGYFMDQNPPEMVTELYRDEQPKLVKREGREYELIEREYLLFPQRSGDITIPAPVFSSRDLFVKGKKSTIKVKPRPDGGEWHWLPAQALKLEQKLDLPKDGIRQGMQLERIITIRAKGLTGAQLPELAPPNINGLEVQDLGSTVEHTIVDGVMVGERHIKQLLIPTQAGNFTIPVIEMKWWDTSIDQPNIARLTAAKLQVSKNQIELVAPKKTPVSQTDTEDIQEDKEQLVIETELANLKEIAILISLLVYGLLIWHYRLFSRFKAHWQMGNQKRIFQKACRENDQAKACEALLAWGKLHWSSRAPVSILGYRERFDDPDVQLCLRDLDRANFSHNREWSGTSALELITPYLKSARVKQTRKLTNNLPPLYN